jgi:hypothetical protein
MCELSPILLKVFYIGMLALLILAFIFLIYAKITDYRIQKRRDMIDDLEKDSLKISSLPVIPIVNKPWFNGAQVLGGLSGIEVSGNEVGYLDDALMLSLSSKCPVSNFEVKELLMSNAPDYASTKIIHNAWYDSRLNEVLVVLCKNGSFDNLPSIETIKELLKC